MTQRKFICFDCDRSLATIGGPERQKEVFGIAPMPISGGVDQLLTYLGKLIQKEQTVEKHPLFGDLPGETRFVLNEQARQMGLTGIMIDTISVLALQTKEAMLKKEVVDPQTKQKKMVEIPPNENFWGLYKDKLVRFTNLIAQLDVPVIATSHIARDKDENGGPIDVIAVQGGAKMEIPRFFDVILYSRQDRDMKTGQVYYSWQTRGDGRRPVAKTRGDVLPPTMDQNLALVLDMYQEAGIHAPKILVLGDSGQGKTTSLGTINVHVNAQVGTNGVS